jgi:pyruvate kinase
MTQIIRRAKIVATLGPSSNSVEEIEKMINEGLNVARVNMSHGSHADHAQRIANVREASKRCGYEVAILMDLQGPKIRVDKLPENLELKNGDEWVIGPTKVKDKYPEYQKNFIPTIYEKLVEDSTEGTRILFDDGLIVAKAVKKDREVLKIKILVGGILKSNKGINLPDIDVSAPSLTEKDIEDLNFGLTQNIDYIALSFVRKKEDILELKKMLHKMKVQIPIVAKIEKPQAIDNIEGILEATDVIMVARGDMGVELGNHLVPTVQKKLISLCNARGIPVITATQMLESMITNSSPTRAEASDVANAIWDGTDAVMLSGETASGKYPLEAIQMMHSIIIEAEKAPKERPLLRNVDLSDVVSATMVAASLIAEKVFAKRLVCVTETGHSALKLTRFRPITPVLAITSKLKTVRRLCLYWGVSPYFLKEVREDDEKMEYVVIELIKKQLKLINGDKIVISRGGGKFFARGTSNSIRVEVIKDIPKVLGSSDGIEECVDAQKKIQLDTNICGSCYHCVSVCPHEIWTLSKDQEKRTMINASKVKDCAMDMECVRACPTGAIEIIPNFSDPKSKNDFA